MGRILTHFATGYLEPPPVSGNSVASIPVAVANTRLALSRQIIDVVPTLPSQNACWANLYLIVLQK
jgi:hypothetical protein